MKLRLLAIFIFSVFAFSSLAQTSVKGLISSNTAWTKINSPYIVDSTVFVLPNTTLTIEPGVTVKFADGQSLQIQDGALIAMGTRMDSITFTSNSSSPVKGIYPGIYLSVSSQLSQFNYCNFKYADFAIQNDHVNDTLTAKNSVFELNNNGLSCPFSFVGVDSCIFSSNGTALIGGGTTQNSVFFQNQIGIAESGQNSFVNNCIISSGQTGITGTAGKIVNTSVIYNQLGIDLGYNTVVDNCNISSNGTGLITQFNTCPPMWDSIRNCTIDSNTIKGVEINLTSSIYKCNIRNNNVGLNIANGTGIIVSKNYIENNMTGIEMGIVDAYVSCNKICGSSQYNVNVLYPSTKSYMMTHNYWCTSLIASVDAKIFDGYDDPSFGHVHYLPLDSTCYLNTAVNEMEDAVFNLYPNPSTGKFILETNSSAWINAEMEIYNSIGEKVYSISGIDRKANIDISWCPEGIYFIRLYVQGIASIREVIIAK